LITSEKIKVKKKINREIFGENFPKISKAASRRVGLRLLTFQSSSCENLSFPLVDCFRVSPVPNQYRWDSYPGNEKAPGRVCL